MGAASALTAEDPDTIVTGRKGELIALRHYPKTSISEKHVVEVVGITVLHASEVGSLPG